MRGESIGVAVALLTLTALGFGPWILYRTGYAFERDALVIRGGPFRWRAPFADIRNVEPSQNPLSMRSSPVKKVEIASASLAR